MFTTRPEITGTFGVVASTHWVASQVAMGVLERGGNAFDAAVAGGFALQIVEPHLCGPAGDLPILYWDESTRQVRSICGQGWAPGDATPAAMRARGLEQVPGIGLLAATVPGAFDAWLTLLRDRGSWSLADVLAPAIHYAEGGFPVARRLTEALLAVRPLFTEHWPSSADVWLSGSRVPAAGSLHRLPALARTYRDLIRQAEREGSSRTATIDAARRIWREGFIADAIDRFVRTQAVWDSSGERNTGFLGRDDMAEWQATDLAPVLGDFGRYRVAKCGFWSQGPMLLQQLQLLRYAELERDPEDETRFVHRVAEAAKLSFGDRLAWYGVAPGARPELQAALLSDTYARTRWLEVSADRASASLRAGSPLGFAPRFPDLTAAERTLARADTRFGVGEPTFATLAPVSEWADRELFVGDTCHIDVIDRHGNMVAATPSGGWLSSSPVIPALGFPLGTRLQMTWLDEGLPNTLTPRTAPCTTLSPSIALRDGEPYMAFGTPGGDQQDQWSTAFFLRHAVQGLNLQEAIDAPAWHVKHGPASFWPRQVTLNAMSIESRFTPQTLEALNAMGHRTTVGGPWSEGRLSACTRQTDSKGRRILRAAANARGMQGYAVGR